MKSRKKNSQQQTDHSGAAAVHTITKSESWLTVEDEQRFIGPFGWDKHPDSWTVYKKIAGTYEVFAGEQTLTCKLSAELRPVDVDLTKDRRLLREALKAKRAAIHTDPVVVGDEVLVNKTGEGTGTIIDVLPRRSRLSRRSAVPMPDAHAFEQVIAANVDQVAPVFSAANPAPKWNLLDRYLVSAESLNLASLIIITKIDLTPGDDELAAAVEEYRSVGYQVILTSAATGEGISGLKVCLDGKITVLVGKSGVGKTSLLNALQPGLGLRINAVSQVTGKGRHTTTYQEMFPISAGAALEHGAIVDTPGIREFGLWEVDASDLTSFFPEMRPYLGKCRFGTDCRHDEEPGCAIRKAVSGKAINPRRYLSYLRLCEEVSG